MIYSIIFIILGFLIFYPIHKVRTFFKKIIRKYTQLLILKTDWYVTYLEYFAKKILDLFYADFVSIFSVKQKDQVRELISLGTSSTNFLSEFVIKDDFFFSKVKKSSFLYFYKVPNIFVQDSNDMIKQASLKYAIMIPVSFDKITDEAYICLYFKSFFKYALIYFFNFFIYNRFSYYTATILRNFYTHFNNSFALFLEEIDDYVALSLDKDAHIISWNRGAEKLFGYRSFEIISQKFSVLFDFDEKDTFSKSLEILEVKKDVKFFASLKDRMNIPIRVELTIKSMSNALGDLIGYSVFVKDITKEEIFKENIQQHSFINYTILENSQDGILILDAQDKIIFYNQRVRLILDNSMNLFGILGKKIFPRHFSEEFEKNIDLLKKSGKEFIDLDYCFDYKYYNIRFFQVYKNANHEYGGVIIFFIDESVRMLTMLELEEKKEALEKINSHLLDALKSAHQMQLSLVPDELPKKYIDTEAIYQLSDDLGGDFYYVENIKYENKDYGVIFISDVSGHGISSSMLNVMVKDVYTTYKDMLQNGENLSTGLFLDLLNKKIHDLQIGGNKFITCLMAILDYSSNTIQMSSAGHPLPFLINDQEITQFVFTKTVPVGIVDEFECIEETFSYKEGDRFIFYTDGLLEMFEQGNVKPTDNFKVYLESMRENSLVDLKEDILERYKIYKKNQQSFADDLTMIFTQINNSKNSLN